VPTKSVENIVSNSVFDNTATVGIFDAVHNITITSQKKINKF
jgi:hypothetical protein